MPGTDRKRPWLAALLTFVYPGLGHAYLREWVRALLWFGTVLAAVSVLIPSGIVPETMSVDAVTRMYTQFPTEAMAALTVITFMSMVDAYWMATRRNQHQEKQDEGLRCPTCGRDVDEDIDFCHWCTTRLDTEETDEPSRV